MPLPEASEDLRALVEEIAKVLVDNSDEVSAGLLDEGARHVVTLRVAPGDLGKVIGKQGRTARSIRAILAAASLRQPKPYGLEILE